ncbi:PASTA domain-containing protein [Bacteroidetes/Chlorobi group bacterium ChocPot_Mid]|jgi:serine/threonine-protein kinase|nr:MAG: PASTA domain-containing protein [Bacteroidetes/Chlorobi group bacterium ChocPot_Mid]
MKIDKEKLMEYKPHAYIFGGFCVSLLIIFFILDSWILPAWIHGGEIVTVPDVTGLPLHEAQAKLEQAGLNYHIYTEQNNDEYPENYVINQNPKPKRMVKSGRHINLTISKGGEPVIMPNIMFKPLRYARVALMERGLYIGNIEYVFSDSVGVDTVISQNIRPGKTISFGDYVNLVVSKGMEAEIEVPNLTGKTLAEVEAILEASNLQLGTINSTYDEIYAATYLRNTVVGQFPSPGNVVVKNTKIDITFFR